jgi:hypothetical protein
MVRAPLLAALALAAPAAAGAGPSGLTDRRLLEPPAEIAKAYAEFAEASTRVDADGALARLLGRPRPEGKALEDARASLDRARARLVAALDRYRASRKKATFQQLVDDTKSPAWLRYQTGRVRPFLEASELVARDAADYSYCDKQRPPCPIECYQGASRCQGQICTADVSCRAPLYDPYEGR